MTISASLRTSSPFIVTTVAPRRMIVPFGVFAEFRLTAISWTSFFAPSTSFLLFSGLSFRLSSHQPFVKWVLGVRIFLVASFFSSFAVERDGGPAVRRKRLAPTAR